MTALIELYANNAYSILANSITASSTTINVSPGTGSRFPNPTSGTQFFRMTITGASSPNSTIEIVYVTARSTDALTVLRGQEGTTAQSWSVSDLCGNEPTAGMLNQFVQPYTNVDTGVANAYVVNTPQHETSYYTGMPCVFYTIHASTSTTPTLNLNGLGAKTIKNADGTPLLSGQIPANVPISVMYNSSDTSWRLQSPIGIPTGLTPGRAAGIDPSGRITSALSTLVQLNMLSNWVEPLQTITSNPGYIILPTGIYLQFGTVYASTAGGTITFAESFPNAVLAVFTAISTNNASDLSNNGYVGYHIDNNQQITVYSVNGAPAVSVLAIGY